MDFLLIQACLPLIDDLSNPAMRTRHWKQLVRVTGGVVQIDNDSLKRMTLGELLNLGLQCQYLPFIKFFFAYNTSEHCLAYAKYIFIDQISPHC